MAEFRFILHVDAPPAAVYALWTNLERMHEWTEGVTGVSAPSGPLDQPGTTYTVRFGRMSSPTRVSAADPPRLYETRFGNRMLRGVSRTTFEADGDGTRMTQTYTTQGVVAAIVGRIFATGSYKGSFRGELNEFVRIAEREARAV